jgi:hypothetical protein
MHSQLVTAEDRENYGDELISMTQRAAMEALAPEINALRAQNQHLPQMAQRSQRAEIERALDQRVGNWRDTYADPRFSAWLAEPDGYSGAVRSQLLRNAVSNGDSGRVAAIYKGFQQEVGQHVPSGRSYASRSPQPASGASSAILTRPQIAALYERRRKGEFNDAQWAQIEPAIFSAANQGRIAGALDRDGNRLSELR